MLELNEKDYRNLPEILSLFRRTDEKYNTCLLKVFLMQAETEGAYTLANHLVTESYSHALIMNFIYFDLSDLSAMVNANEIIKAILFSNQNNSNGGNK